jgi:2-oxoisovalerate dehydrogenase E1 component alpha subunit
VIYKAVYRAVQEAKKICLEESRPVLIEAMTYRIGHHSTSDDSSAYRSKDEVQDWKSNDSPITRFRQYLEHKHLWNEDLEKEFQEKIRKEVLKAFSKAEKLKKPNIDELFTDVYDVIPSHLQEQQKELKRILRDYPEHFNLDIHAK